jgi:ribosome maturation factor RimP
MIEKGKIEKLVNECLDGTTMFITAITIKLGNNIMVFLDGDQGVSISDCVKVSRHIESSLNRDEEDFELHVSSHGLTSPLVLPRQFKNHIGKSVSVLLKNGIKKTGTILSASEVGFVFTEEEKKKKKKKEEVAAEPITIQYEEIKEVKVNISF